MERENDNFQRLRNSALRILQRREHSRAELAAKLRQREADTAVVEALLDELESANWLSNDRFAASLSRQRRQQGYGPLRIQAELTAKGIDAEGRARADFECHSETPLDWVAQARQLLRKRFGAAATDYATRSKQYQYLARRGYTAAQIRAALGSEDEG